MLEVLNDPNLEELLQRPWVSDSLKSILQNSSQHTLWASGFPVKTREVSRARTSGLRMMNRAWVGLGIVLLFSLVIGLCMVSRGWTALVVIGLLVVGGGYMLLPSLSSLLKKCGTG